jgi:uncharacterized protein (UPF0548 family)
VISRRPPTKAEIETILDELEAADFSYPDLGATRGSMPNGYNIDRHSGIIGHGDAAFESAKQGIRDWAPFDLPWIRIFPRSEPRVGTMIAVVARVFGFWWTNVSRVVYTIDEPDCFGFAYGTLPLHAETGEEVFKVEQSTGSDEIRYRIVAFSKPRHPLARLGLPFSRATQHRFGRGSIEAMHRIATQSGESPENSR